MRQKITKLKDSVVGNVSGSCNMIFKHEFLRFLFVGGTSTIVDWGMFYLFAIILLVHHEISLVISSLSGFIVNFSMNKLFTFKCKSKKIIRQFSAYLLIAIIVLLISMLLLYLFVDILSFDKMLSRIFITLLMIPANYVIHKTFTFNKRFFD